jgi:hypothetical protein
MDYSHLKSYGIFKKTAVWIVATVLAKLWTAYELAKQLNVLAAKSTDRHIDGACATLKSPVKEMSSSGLHTWISNDWPFLHFQNQSICPSIFRSDQQTVLWSGQL